ncbi:hypothetical protein Acr_00g0042590 [Actinidia rufa]|uniref:Uncharacterized protein n=1 Tax=Actinidia rufa TaxID=165716 RepID=A0A7J0DIC4_9ERIC|nr:hypothetical protein Acr_00g0042590 [Actinidia rufa]
MEPVDRKQGNETILEVFEIGADQKPLGGVAGEVIRAEEGGNHRRNASAMLEEPIPLQNSGGLTGIGGLLGSLSN